MSQPNIIEVECRDQKIEKIVVFNDRAEISRKTYVELLPGVNEVHVRNVSPSTVYDSLRVDGKGDASILEVQTTDRPAVKQESDSPRLAEIRGRLEVKKREVDGLKDKKDVLSNRVEALNKAVLNVTCRNNDGTLNVDQVNIDSMEKFYDFYEQQAVIVKERLRNLQEEIRKAEEEQNKIQQELGQLENGRSFIKVFVITLESANGGKVQLDINYQVFGARWNPSYDLRVDSTPHMKITYFGQISQNTGEDWNDVSLVLSTAQPCLGGNIPELGTLEASFWRQAPVQRPMVRKAQAGGLFGSAPQPNAFRAASLTAFSDAGELESMTHVVVNEVQEQVLSTEFTIARPATIPTGGENHKVTIGIIDLKPQLVYECVPKKNTSAFLTAAAINESQLPFLQGDAAVYLNNCFVAKVTLKSVSPGERFSCSLGVDPAIRVTYKPAKKYHEQSGLITKVSSAITEQVINIKNTRSSAILLTIKEHIPRSTDEKLKIRVLQPANITAPDEAQTHISDGPIIRPEGVKMTAANNLEWTVKCKAGQVQDLVIKYALDYPKEEKVIFSEKF